MSSKKQAALFLDRDGTIIEDLHYPREPEKVTLIPGAIEALKLMEKKGYWIFVISNQAGVEKGFITKEEFKAVHLKTVELLEAEKVFIKDYFYCFSKEDSDPNRKPNPGMVPREFEGKRLDWERSFVVGDRETDLGVADNIGAKAYLVMTGKGEKSAAILKAAGTLEKYKLCRDLLEVARDLPQAC